MKYNISTPTTWATMISLGIGVAMLVSPFVLWARKPELVDSFLFSLLICLPLSAIFFWLVLAQRNAGVELTPKGLRLRLPFYGRLVDYDKLDLEAMEAVDLKAKPTLMPRLRTNGVGLPGLHLGWHRMRDKQKALLAVTQKDKVLKVPTHDGYLLLVSVDSPLALAEAIRRRAANSRQ